MGHEVHFFAMHDPRNAPCSDEKYFVRMRDYNKSKGVVSKVSDAVNLLWSRESRNQFEQLLQDVRPDVIHLNLIHRQISLSILDAPSIKGIPVIYTSHEYILLCPAYTMMNGKGEICEECIMRESYLACFKNKCVKASRAKSLLASAEACFIHRKKYYDRFCRIIAPSAFMKYELTKGGFAGDRIEVMQNFLPDAYLKTVGGRTQHLIQGPYFLYFGRLSKEKGIYNLIDAYYIYKETHKYAWRLAIVGDGPEYSVIESRIADKQLSDSVILLGKRSGDELRALIEDARFSVMPSIWYENSPYSALESLAAGTPLIASNIGGLPEMVLDNTTGYLVAPGDCLELSKALCAAHEQSRDQYAAMQNHSIELINSNHSEKKYVKHLVKLYEEQKQLMKD